MLTESNAGTARFWKTKEVHKAVMQIEGPLR
jgi:hypothetical protein